jgi:hypothetical protein
MTVDRNGRALGVTLWIVAFVAMFAAASYQRRTGPTYEYHGTLEVAARTYHYALIRSEETTRDARVALPLPGDGASGRIMVRRYPTDDPFTPVEMREETVDGSTELAGYLPAQPAAGKLEYYIELHTSDGDRRIPEVGGAKDGGSTIVMRFKDHVPLPLLLSHVLFMFVSMLIGVRAALGAAVGETKARRLAWVTLVGLSIGGMILGPFVQKYAFGAFWTGFPWGYDLTDNKTLIMWLAWVVACGVLLLGGKERPTPSRAARLAVAAAAVVMVGVYLIPHSLRGSQLDYGQVNRGVDPQNAIEVGR